MPAIMQLAVCTHVPRRNRIQVAARRRALAVRQSRTSPSHMIQMPQREISAGLSGRPIPNVEGGSSPVAAKHKNAAVCPQKRTRNAAAGIVDE